MYIHIYIIQHRQVFVFVFFKGNSIGRCLLQWTCGFVRPGSVQYEGLKMEDLQKDTVRDDRELHKTARKTGDSDNPSEERRRAGEGIDMVVGVEKGGNCSVDYACVPSSIGQ